MGIADLVPGVSGGTIALITGIYQELLSSINQFTLENIKKIRTEGFVFFFKAVNGPFLAAIFGGIITSILCFSFLLEWLITNEPIALWSFFFGLLIASILLIAQSIRPFKAVSFLFILAGAITSFLLSKLTGTTSDSGYVYLFFSGFIGISAMILPGLSGAYILLILGVYESILATIRQAIEVLTNFDQTIFIATYSKLLVFGLGILFGLRIFAGFLSWLFKKYPRNTMATLIGLMIGALHKIWPWQNKIPSLKETANERTLAVLPNQFEGIPEMGKALLFVVIGLVLLLTLEKIKPQKNDQ